jgi:16S rRNA (guanine527-N7)-methyltransferase
MAKINKKLEGVFNQAISELSLSISQEQSNSLFEYMNLLIKWNKVYNLSALNEPKDILIKHIIDCLATVQFIPIQLMHNVNENNINDINIADIGSGAGLPGIIWAIMRPDINVYSIDCVHKKISFQIQAKINLGLYNFHPLHTRVEDFNPMQHKIQIITCRAYDKVAGIIEQTMHLSPQQYILLKGKEDFEDYAGLKDKFGFNIDTININVPFLDAQRHIVLLKK